MHKLITVLVGFTALQSCTLSMNMVRTQGTASDVVDENQSPTPTVTTNLSVPVSAIPK